MDIELLLEITKMLLSRREPKHECRDALLTLVVEKLVCEGRCAGDDAEQTMRQHGISPNKKSVRPQMTSQRVRWTILKQKKLSGHIYVHENEKNNIFQSIEIKMRSFTHNDAISPQALRENLEVDIFV